MTLLSALLNRPEGTVYGSKKTLAGRQIKTTQKLTKHLYNQFQDQCTFVTVHCNL